MAAKVSFDGISQDLKKLMRKQSIPNVCAEALSRLQQVMSVSTISPEILRSSNEILQEYVFFERRRKPLTAFEELQILDMICTSFSKESDKPCKHLFYAMFTPTPGNVWKDKVQTLSKLLSLAITLKVSSVLDCAAYWLHTVGVDSAVSLTVVKNLAENIFEDGSFSQKLPNLASLVHSSPLFCATFVTVMTFLFSEHPPSKNLLQLVACWLESNLNLSYVPLEEIKHDAHTFVPGLITWIVLARPTNGYDATIMNRLHLYTLKVLLKAPKRTLHESHFVKLSTSVRVGEQEDVERFVQLIQVSLASKCFEEKPIALQKVLENLPSTVLTIAVLQNNSEYLT